MVNMLVKIWLYLTKALTTGDVDEVRVQSEEPDLKKPAQGNLSGLFALIHCPSLNPELKSFNNDAF